MYQMKRFIDMEQSPGTVTFVCLCFCFHQLGLCSVSYTANEYSIFHFCILMKDFSISFSRVIIVQDFETVTFYVLFVCKYVIFIYMLFLCVIYISVIFYFKSVLFIL